MVLERRKTLNNQIKHGNFMKTRSRATATPISTAYHVLRATAIILSELRRWKRRSRATRVRFNSTCSAWAKYQPTQRCESARRDGAFTKDSDHHQFAFQSAKWLGCWSVCERPPDHTDDATLYFRRANLSEIKVAEPDEVWKTTSRSFAIRIPKLIRKKATTPECCN